MKKIVALLAALTLAVSLTACGGAQTGSAAPAEETDAPAENSTPFAGKNVSVMTPYLSSITTNQMVGYLQDDLTASRT